MKNCERCSALEAENERLKKDAVYLENLCNRKQYASADLCKRISALEAALRETLPHLPKTKSFDGALLTRVKALLQQAPAKDGEV